MKFKKGYTPWNKGKKCPQISKALKGHCLSEEHKEKISIAHKGIPRPYAIGNKNGFKKGYIPWNKGGKLSKEHIKKCSLALLGKISPMKGKKHSEKTKKNMSEQRKGKKNHFYGKHHTIETREKLKQYCGDKASNWQGGKSFEPYGIEFNKILKEQIKQRDRFRCQECFRHQDELKYPLNIHHIDYDKKNNDPENLISLCRTCHGQTHWNRENWTSYFQARRCGELQ